MCDDHVIRSVRRKVAVALTRRLGGTLAVAPGGLPGLHDVPVDFTWVAHRLAWLPADAAVLAGYVIAARRFEISRPRSTAAGAVAGASAAHISAAPATAADPNEPNEPKRADALKSADS